jgi:hypothetical protein
MDPIATLQDDRSRNFFINASKQCFSKENVIYFHPKKAKQGQSFNTIAARTSRTAIILEAQIRKIDFGNFPKKNYTIRYNTKWYNF